MRQLPARIEGQGVLLRRWRVTDAERLERAVVESAEHLRPWMAWMTDEPQTLDQRRRLLSHWEQEWASAGDAVCAVLVDRAVAGSCGLHRRLEGERLRSATGFMPRSFGGVSRARLQPY